MILISMFIWILDLNFLKKFFSILVSMGTIFLQGGPSNWVKLLFLCLMGNFFLPEICAELFWIMTLMNHPLNSCLDAFMPGPRCPPARWAGFPQEHWAHRCLCAWILCLGHKMVGPQERWPPPRVVSSLYSPISRTNAEPPELPIFLSSFPFPTPNFYLFPTCGDLLALFSPFSYPESPVRHVTKKWPWP